MTAAITHLEIALDTTITNRKVAFDEGDIQRAYDYDTDILEIEASLEVLRNSTEVMDTLVGMRRSFSIHIGYVAIVAAFALVGVVHVAHTVFAFFAQ